MPSKAVLCRRLSQTLANGRAENRNRIAHHPIGGRSPKPLSSATTPLSCSPARTSPLIIGQAVLELEEAAADAQDDSRGAIDREARSRRRPPRRRRLRSRVSIYRAPRARAAGIRINAKCPRHSFWTGLLLIILPVYRPGWLTLRSKKGLGTLCTPGRQRSATAAPHRDADTAAGRPHT